MAATTRPDPSDASVSATTPAQATVAWWRRCVVYQVYLRSFADGNGDGTGDLAGLRSRLGYLSELGVNAIWINPWYPSPLADGGYDVADYRDVDARFGTLAEAEALLREAKDHGIRVLIDLVPNHTSIEHRWFVEALAAGPGAAARDRYLFRSGRGPSGADPPSDWRSVFGGPAWTRLADGDWYLHLFDNSQPDLNWNHPEVNQEFDEILRFWLDRGVDGFRVDVAHSMMKDQSFPDLGDRFGPNFGQRVANHPHWDRDEIHDVIRRWRRILDEYDDRMMVAEANVRPDRLPLYLRPDEYHQSFNFDLLQAPWRAEAFRSIIERAITAGAPFGAAQTWVLSNHDCMRHATRYGLPVDADWRHWLMHGPSELLDAGRGRRRARAAALVTLSLPGSVYVYQGEELGLPEVWDLPVEVLDDPVWRRSSGTEKGRDGCRVPLPWTAAGPSFGFGASAAWLPQPAGFAALAAASQAEDPESMLSLYRAAISLRATHLIQDEEFALVDLGEETVAYRRGSGVTCIANMGTEPIVLPEGEVLLASSPTDPTDRLLHPDSAVWLLTPSGR